MKRIIKVLFVLLVAFFFFSMGKEVEANSIQSISMDIFVDNSGDAHVTETWKCNVTDGTEVYHPYYNLGNSEIKDLTVSESATKYTTLSEWNTSGTLTSKANKCGINEISNGVELCWGISKYGSHTYTAKYTITNFVSETTDAQMIYWTLIPYDFSTSIGNMYIKIHTNFKIQDTIDVWGYGNYGGTAYVYDGYIEMQSDGKLATDEYMTILVKFPLETFDVTNKLDNDFEYYYDMAEEGSIEYREYYKLEKLRKWIYFLPNVPFIPFIIMIIIAVIKPFKFEHTIFKYGVAGEQIPKDVPYFRDIPCKKDIFRAYYIGKKYGIIEKKSDVLGAIILKWIKDGVISIEEKETGLVFKKENTVVVLNETEPEIFLDSRETELFKMLYSASKDGYLENKEFEKWCRKSYSKILSWFEEIMDHQEKKLIKEGLIEKIDNGKSKHIKSVVATPELKQEAVELAGLKRYLNEYTLIKEREAIEVQLFEEYLIFAQIMGIAKKVAKQFKDIYPDIIEQSCYTSFDYILFVHESSYRGVSAAKTAKSRAESYSSGGGGYSSGGGGGGSFGGRWWRTEVLDKNDKQKLIISKIQQNTCQKQELKV